MLGSRAGRSSNIQYAEEYLEHQPRPLSVQRSNAFDAFVQGRALLVFVIAVQALLLFHNGTWNYHDGAPVDYAIHRGDLTGLRKWFFDSNWHLLYWFFKGEAMLASATHIHFRYFEYAILTACMVASWAAVERISRTLFGDSINPTFAGMLMAANPIWGLGMSSVAVPELLLFASGLLGASLILASRSTLALLAGVFAVIVGFQFNTVATMTLAIAMLAVLLRKDLKRRALVLGLISVLGCLVILVLQRLSPPVGPYAGYNSVSLDLLNTGGLPQLKSLAEFATPFILIAATFRLIRGANRSVPWRKDPITLCLLAALVASFPYILLYRTAGFLDTRDWSMRFGIMAMPFLSIAAARLASLEFRGRAGMRVLSLTVLLPVVALTVLRYVRLADRRAQEKHLVANLALRRPEKSGTIIPGLTTPNNQHYRSYELSWLGFKAWQSSANYPCVNRAHADCLEDTKTWTFTSVDRAVRLGYITDEFR